ncbi:hypothetical protein ES703_04754 [subsurface metagenome]
MKHDLNGLNNELEKKQNRLDEIIEGIEEFENLLSKWYITPEQFFAITYRIRELEREKEDIVEEDIEEINRLIEKVERDLEQAEEIEDLETLGQRMGKLKVEMEGKIEDIENKLGDAEENLDSAQRELIKGLIGALVSIKSLLASIYFLGVGAWEAYIEIKKVRDILEEVEDLQLELTALGDEADGLIDRCNQLLDELVEVSECVVCGLKYPTDEMVEFVGGGFICGECQDGECDICSVGYSTAVGGTSVVKVTAISDCNVCTSNEGFYREQPDLESLNHPNCQCDVEEMELCPKCLSEIGFKD